MCPGAHVALTPEMMLRKTDEPAYKRVLKRAAVAVFIVLSLELGLLLLVAPWTANWDHNFFLTQLPGLRDFILSPYVRGAISGLGLLNLWMGTGKISHFHR